MTIKELTEDAIEQTCDVCGHVQTSNLDDLTIGVAAEERVNPDVVPMPHCESCGAIEYLIPSKVDAPAHPYPGSKGHRHALLVDVLHERLVDRGHVIPEVDADNLKKKKHTKDELDLWFKEGFKLAKPINLAPTENEKTTTAEESPDAE